MKLRYYTYLEGIKQAGQWKCFDEVAQMNVFVHDDIRYEADLFQYLLNMPDAQEIGIDDNEEHLDLPFEKCFFEASVHPLIEQKTKHLYDYFKTDAINEFIDMPPLAVGVVERGFNKYTFYTFFLRPDGLVSVNFFNDDNKSTPKQREIHKQLKQMVRGTLKLIARQAKGSVPSRQIKSINIGGIKKHYSIKDIVFCAPKIQREKYAKRYNKNIDWSHSWQVSGHWRRVKTIGKDRYGNYGVKGATWVSPHIKGQGELVKKLRVIKGGKQ